jgi:hypothetical protein
MPIAAREAQDQSAFRMNFRQLMVNKRELLILAAVTAAFVCVMVAVRVRAVDWQRGDTALFFQVAENIGRRGEPVSQVFANTQGYLEGKTSALSLDALASNPLTPPAADERNMMKFHAYWFLYVVGFLTRFFPTDSVFFFFMSASFIGLVLLCYLVLRREKIPIVAALAFCLLVISHPAWSESFYAGQPFPDRFFLLPGFLFMYLVTRPNASRVRLALLAVLCASINERAAIVAGGFVGLYTLAHRREHTCDRNFRLMLCALLVIFGGTIIKFFLQNGEYGHFLPTTLGEAWFNVSSFHALRRLTLFLAVNFPFLFLAFFEWRTASVALVLMFPNIFGDIGGGEKVGWSTSYHTYYQPSLMLAALIGYVRLYRLTELRKLQWTVGVPVLGALVAYLCLLSPVNARPIRFGTAYVRYHFIPTLLDYRARYFGAVGTAIASTGEQLRSAVPDHAVVTTIEAGMPLLYQRHVIRVFPIDIERADYALMTYEDGPQGTRYYGEASLVKPDEQKKIDAMLLRRMRRDGYDFAHARKFPIFALALVKRAPESASLRTR